MAPNILVKSGNGNPVLFRAGTPKVARFLLETVASEGERQEWLDTLYTADWTIFDHLQTPRGGGHREYAEMTKPMLEAELRNLYEIRESLCQY